MRVLCASAAYAMLLRVRRSSFHRFELRLRSVRVARSRPVQSFSDAQSECGGRSIVYYVVSLKSIRTPYDLHGRLRGSFSISETGGPGNAAGSRLSWYVWLLQRIELHQGVCREMFALV